MSAPVHVHPVAVPGPGLTRALYRFTVHQYARLIADGTVAEEERLELIDGLLVVRPRRARAEIVAGNKGLRVLWRMIPSEWHVARGMPILIPDWSRPEPDLAVLRGVVDDYEEREARAEETALVVEISGAEPTVDRSDRTRIYAAAGIPVYWIVDLAAGQIAIHSEPYREGYRSRQVLTRGQDVPVTVAGVEVAWIAVSDLLP
jgi:Uma2 family endonuclease